MIAFPRQTARAAHGETHAAILACAQAKSTLPSDGGMFGIEPHVTWHKQIQQAIPIIVAPSWPCGPTAKSDAGFLRSISKRSIVIVVIETVLSVVGNVDVRPAIIVVIAHSHAESPSLIRHAGFGSYIGEGAVMIVVQEHSAGSGLLPFQRSKRGPIEQVDVQPAVIVIINQSYARTRGLEDSRLFWSSRAMVELVKTGLLRDVCEYDWRAVYKSPRRDRAGHGVFHGSARRAGRHPGRLLLLRLALLRFLRRSALPKPRRQHGGSQTTPAKNALSHASSCRS